MAFLKFSHSWNVQDTPITDIIATAVLEPYLKLAESLKKVIFI